MSATSGPEAIKVSCSAQLSMIFPVHNVEMPTIVLLAFQHL